MLLAAPSPIGKDHGTLLRLGHRLAKSGFRFVIQPLSGATPDNELMSISSARSTSRSQSLRIGLNSPVPDAIEAPTTSEPKRCQKRYSPIDIHLWTRPASCGLVSRSHII